MEKLLGPRKFSHEVAEAGNRVGVTTGLVWTEFGGELIFVEASQMRGHQQLILTGSLGTVLQESAQTALELHPQPRGRISAWTPTFSRTRTSTSTSPRAPSPRKAPPRG